MAEKPPPRDPNRPAPEWPTLRAKAGSLLAYAGSRLAAGTVRVQWKVATIFRPNMVCVCREWSPCTAYYLKGWYAYCYTCGYYSPC